MNLPDSFYTVETLFSLGGSASAVWIFTSVAGYLFPSNVSSKVKKWLGLFLSLLIAFLGASIIENQNLSTWTVSFINGLLIYLTSVGANTITSNGATSMSDSNSVRETSSSKSTNRGNFREPWW